jgi:hypothetical protein
MTIKIGKNIAGYEVVKPEEEKAARIAAAEERAARVSAKVVRMTEKVMRPEGMESLEGSTYKEQRRPFEIFINSKNMDHFQWIVALTRLMSAVFRKGGDVTFLAEELQAVFDPKGGYFKPGGRFMPSIIAEIGDVIAHHMQKIGLMEKEELSEQQKLILKQKRAEVEGPQKQAATDSAGEDAGYPASATLCNKCHTKAVVVMDNCATCLSCGYSKCG